MDEMTNSMRIGALFLVVLVPGLVVADGSFLRTAAPLDEPRGYCLDVAGFGVNVRVEAPLRAHTCRYDEDNADQLFQWVDFESGQVTMPAYDLCLASESLNPGAQLFVEECENSDTQNWTFVPNGNLVLTARPELCLTVWDDRSDAGADILVFPGYQARSSSMELCRERGDELQNFRWGRDDEKRRGLANGLRLGMSESFQAEIRSMHAADRTSVATTNELYADVERTYRKSEVATTMDIAYGAHERHKLDVHVDTRRRGDALQPVIVYFHGGGYTRGSKEGSHNVGEYFASIGLVGVSATYRLAPEIQWPEGASDVGAAVQWVTENIEEYGGDPERIFVVGKSAGGGHVATYAFRPELLDADYPRVAGVVLVSASFRSGSEEYFGAGAGAPDRAVQGNVSTVDMAALLTTSEFELDGLAAESLALAHELSGDHGYQPRIRQLAGHNHYSPNLSIGTSDRMLSDEILDFVLNQ